LVYRITQPFLSSAEPAGRPIPLEFPETPDPDKEFHIRIPIIGVDANVTPNVDINDSKAYDEVLKTGVAHAAGTGFPDNDGGQNKTIFIFSHSTNGSWNITRYNALFYSLKDISVEDQIQIWFWGKEYWYKVTEKRIVAPNDTSFLETQMDKEKLVLQTCWPPGTLSKRLLVVAERVSAE
jgi:sortase A